MARPSIYPFFATQDEIDPIYGTPNKIAPSTEKQDFGQRGNKNTLRQDINWLFNTIREWIQFFDEQYDVGTVVTRDNGVGAVVPPPTPTELSLELGGQWEYISGTGDGTLAGRAVKVYRKISEVNV